MLCPAHTILLDCNNIWRGVQIIKLFITIRHKSPSGYNKKINPVKIRSSVLCSFLQPPIMSPLLGRNILLSIIFSNTLSLCSSLNVKDQLTHHTKLQAKL
jgi:hypothetical protein